MTYIGAKNFLIEVVKGNVAKHSVTHKFGAHATVGTSFVPITKGGVYQTPQVSGATTLRIKAGGDANDTAAGTGAREVTLEGLDASGALLTQTLATAGALVSSATATAFLRLFRFYVSGSGTYASAVAGSHSADIVIENSGGGTDWGTIESSGFPHSQSEVGAYTIPDGYTGYVCGFNGSSDSSKTTDLVFFARTGVLQTVAPYDAMRILTELRIEGSGSARYSPASPLKVVGPADIGYMGRSGSANTEVDVDFEILLVQD